MQLYRASLGFFMMFLKEKHIHQPFNNTIIVRSNILIYLGICDYSLHKSTRYLKITYNNYSDIQSTFGSCPPSEGQENTIHVSSEKM